ncbi:sulfotransferase [Candidatus Brocadia sinica JPN1]|uniref:Sulfotransferase n=1 Tax=Candidatus Brocadia sinica JPN1 TaxID=1197129 RepID=A0ABQ0JS18_9BACT|nr:sulfotransferase [Candidatus Brocadia sinica JPN1]
MFPDAKFIHIVRDGRDVFDSWRKMNSFNDNVAAAALDWRYKLFRIEKSFKKIPEENKITIRYEDLLENPENTIKSICSVIGIGRL